MSRDSGRRLPFRTREDSEHSGGTKELGAAMLAGTAWRVSHLHFQRFSAFLPERQQVFHEIPPLRYRSR